jgi:hypothetical protein
MLAALQQHLTDIYQADCCHPIADFLITDRTIANCIGEKALVAGVEETVLVAEDDDGIAVSIYLDQALLSRLEDQDPLHELRPKQLGDLSTVLEGISHFNYLVWSALQDRSVTLLELELQAEVDKFVATTLMALEQNDFEFARELHRWLFDEVSFQPSLDCDQRERYEVANNYAARFCHRIIERVGGSSGLQELRDFYRLNQSEKIGYIHSLAWSQAG